MTRTSITCLLVLAALASAPAFAGGPLALCNPGQPYLWPAGGAGIPFNPDQGDLGPLTGAQAVALTQQSFDVWGAVPTATASYADAGFLPVDVDITNFGPYYNSPAPDGYSAIVFDDTGEIFDLLFGPGSGVLGFATPEWGNSLTCQITEGLAFLNGPAFTDLTYASDVMVHEFGHYSNLAHTVVNGQIFLGDTSGPSPDPTFGTPALTDIETMYPFYFGPGSGFSTLARDDEASLSTLYPAPGFASSTGTISGTIYAANGTTPLAGVNVIARNVADPFADAVSAISSDFTQGLPTTGLYTLEGLTPGAQYDVFVDQILAGGFSTPPLVPLPGPEELYNGALESSDGSTDLPLDATPVTAVAGSPVTGIDIVFNSPPPGVLDLGDDDNVELPLPFDFTLCGQTFGSVFVSSNGNLTFGAGSNDFSESAAELLSGPPRIAGVWDDLNPTQGGSISFASGANTFTVTFDQVPEYPNVGANSFTFTLRRASDHVDVDYGDVSATDGLAGVSCGGQVASGTEAEEPLRTVPVSRTINLNGQPAIYELFDGNDNDLGGYSLRYANLKKAFTDVFEPNDTLAEAAPITLPFDSGDARRFTAISPVGGDVDFFRFEARAGTTLIAEITHGSLDSVLGLYDVATGTQVDFDDDGGAGFLSRIVYAVPFDGEYALAVSAYPDTDFTGDGTSGGRYVLDARTIEGSLLDLGDDDSEEVPLGFGFPFQGTTYTSVFVNSNGNLTFGSGNTDFTESVAELLSGPPRIAALWDDLSPNNGGTVIVSGDASSWTVEFQGVPEFSSTGANSFAITLGSDGSVAIAYGAVSALDGLAGVSEGGGTADPGATDLSAAASLSAAGTTYQLFTTGNPFDLQGLTLDFQP